MPSFLPDQLHLPIDRVKEGNNGRMNYERGIDNTVSIVNEDDLIFLYIYFDQPSNKHSKF